MKVHDTSQQDKKLMTFFLQKKQRTSDQKLSRGFAMEDKEGAFFFTSVETSPQWKNPAL